MQLIRWLSFSLLVAFAWLAAAAPAARADETNFPVIGGPGNGSFEDRCPAGEYMVIIKGRAGDWVDEVQLVCAHFWYFYDESSNQPPFFRVEHRANWFLGAPRGGSGGVPTEASCGEHLISGMYVRMTTGNRQVKYFDLSCTTLTSDHDFGTATRFNRTTNVYDNVNLGADAPNYQGCATGQVGIGIRGRYGIHVNALSLICGTLDLPPPTYEMTHAGQHPPPPPPPPPPGVIKHTGPSNRPPEPARWDDWVGVWDVTTSQNGFFKFTFTRDGDTLVGKFESPGQPQFSGTTKEQGTSPGMILMFTYEQPGIHGSGSGGFALSPDGKTIRGNAKTNDNPPVKITWTGHKVSNQPN